MKDFDEKEFIEYVTNNRTSQRELVRIFNLKSRGTVVSILKRNNIKITPFTREERKKRIQETWKNKSKEEVEKIVESRNETNMKRYGVENVFELDHIKEKSQNTMIKKYGVKHASQSEEIRKKIESTVMERFGVRHIAYSEEIKEKRRQTNIERYGVENTFQSEEKKKKIRKTLTKRYGVDNPTKNPEIAKKAWESSQETLRALGKDGSKPEIEIREIIEYIGYYNEKKLIKEYDDDGKYIRNWEVDIYVPTLSKGIEFNGNFFHDKDNWEKHNVLTECTWEQCKEHYKTIQAEKHDFTLYHIWEDEWNELDSFENKVSYLSDLLDLY